MTYQAETKAFADRLRKALEAKLPVILLVNKTDRPDARIAEVVDEVLQHGTGNVDDVPDVLEADRVARVRAAEAIERRAAA